MDLNQVYHNFEWSMYNNYQDDAAVPYIPSWPSESNSSPIASPVVFQPYHHQSSLPDARHDTQYGQSGSDFFLPQTSIPFHQYPEYSYPHRAPPTPALDFSPSPVTGNTPDWAFPRLDDQRTGLYEGPALSRSAAVVAPLPAEKYSSDYRTFVDVVSSPSEIGADDIFRSGKRTSDNGAGQYYPSPSPTQCKISDYLVTSPVQRRPKRELEEDEEYQGDDGDADYKPSPRSTSSKRSRSSPSSSPRSRLSTTSHGCRPQTTLDASCLLSTKMVRAPAKDDADDMFKPFICQYGLDSPGGPCHKGFHKKNEWKRHLRTIHAWDEALQIQRGELSFADARLVTEKDGLAEMISEITRCFCSGCGKLFARPEILTRHWNNVEKAEKRKALKAAREQAAARSKARSSASKRISSH